MATVRRSLEQRIAEVERELKELREEVAQQKGRWWEQIVGDFERDESFVEIVRLGAESRRQFGRNSG